MEKAERDKAILALFPELGLSAYSCEDLFHQQALLDGFFEVASDFLKASEALNLIAVVGMPLRVDHLLFNCAVVLCRGKIHGIVPKTFLPNYREFYEYRQFAPAAAACSTEVEIWTRAEFRSGSSLSFSARTSTVYILCGDLRGSMGSDSALLLCGLSRRNSYFESLGIQYYDREG